MKNDINVVPLAGTWIEIFYSISLQWSEGVVPLAGTWIEIFPNTLLRTPERRRSPRGNVD